MNPDEPATHDEWWQQLPDGRWVYYSATRPPAGSADQAPVDISGWPEVGYSVDHPHTDPGDGRTECDVCGKWIFEVTHSCKGLPVTEAARQRWNTRHPARGVTVTDSNTPPFPATYETRP